jgi:hypothetical protein
MQEFTVTSKNFVGSIIFAYDETGFISKLEFKGELEEQHKMHVLKNIPWRVEHLGHYKTKTSYVAETTEITFVRFWDEYGNKKDKETAQKEWNKLTQAEQLKAIANIPRFKFDCHSRNVQLVYPCRYLSKKRFNDE